VARLYTALLTFKPGMNSRSKLGKKQIRLISSGAVDDEEIEASGAALLRLTSRPPRALGCDEQLSLA